MGWSVLAVRQKEREQVLRCNISAVRDCAKWTSCTLISKCDITSSSSLYKDWFWGSKRTFVWCGTRRDKDGDGVCVVRGEKAWENIPVQFLICSTGVKKRPRNHINERKHEEDKEGSGITTGSPYPCWSIERLQCLEAVNWLPVCCIAPRGRCLRFCLSKHIQSGPVFDPLLTYSPMFPPLSWMCGPLWVW